MILEPDLDDLDDSLPLGAGWCAWCGRLVLPPDEELCGDLCQECWREAQGEAKRVGGGAC